MCGIHWFWAGLDGGLAFSVMCVCFPADGSPEMEVYAAGTADVDDGDEDLAVHVGGDIRALRSAHLLPRKPADA